jgi:hypothetical protein
MIEFGKEYFKKPFNFFLKDKGDKISVRLSVSKTLTEGKDKEEEIEIPKKNASKVKTFIGGLMKRDSVPSIDAIIKKLKSYKETAIDEVKETRLLTKIIMKAAKSYIKEKDFKLDDEDKKFLKNQSGDILKLIPLIVIQIFPGSSLATPFIVELGNKLGIKLTSKVPEKYKEKEIKKEGGEIDELVDADGSPIGSNIPILQATQHPRNTMDVTVIATRQTNNPIVRGYRVYYGESEEDKPVLDEEDMSKAFGDEETKNDRTYQECIKSIAKLGIEDGENRKNRCKVFGFEKKYDEQLKQEKKRGRCKNCFTKRRLAELENEKMESLLDEILLSKKKSDDDVVSKNGDDLKSPIAKLLMRNIESIKRIAEKEGISISSLMNKLKK